MLERVPAARQAPRRLRRRRRARTRRTHPRARRAAAGRPGPPRQRHRVRRRRRRAARHPRAAAPRRRHRRRVAGDPRQRRVLRRHQDGAQRAAGRRRRVDAADAAHLPREGARQRAAARGRVGLRRDPRPAARRDARASSRERLGGAARDTKWIWRCHIDLTDANPTVWEFFRPFVEQHDASVWTMPRVRARVARRWTASCTRRRASTRSR